MQSGGNHKHAKSFNNAAFFSLYITQLKSYLQWECFKIFFQKYAPQVCTLQYRHLLGLYKTVSSLALDLNESSDAKQKELIELVKPQLDLCKNIAGNVKADTRTSSTHLPQYSLDTEKRYGTCTKNPADS